MLVLSISDVSGTFAENIKPQFSCKSIEMPALITCNKFNRMPNKSILIFLILTLAFTGCRITEKQGTSYKNPAPGNYVLDPEHFKHYTDYFNRMEDENIRTFIPNEQSWDWMKENIPFFECPQDNFEEIYYFRWWSFRKHIIQTPLRI